MSEQAGVHRARTQWAYDGLPVHTSDRDRTPGDVLGGTKAILVGEQGAARYPLGPPSDVPPELDIVPTRTGHMVITSKGYSVYSSDADAPNKSNCKNECLKTWAPVAAPQLARPHGEWTIVERSPGVQQWAFRGKPLYTYLLEKRTRSMTGSDNPGWRNDGPRHGPQELPDRNTGRFPGEPAPR